MTPGACVVCGSAALLPHLRVRTDPAATLEATTSRYGTAPSDIVRCTVCGHMQVADFPDAPDLDEGYAEVEEGSYLDEEEGQRATAIRALERIERHVTRGRIADLGCWVGFMLSEAERRGWRAQGVEPSRFAAAYARDRLGLDVQTGTLDDADLPEGAFAAVTMGDVIEHLPDPGAGLARIRALLEPDGVVHLALPDAGSRVARLLGPRWWSVLPTHVQYFTRGSMWRLLEGAGFRVEWMATAPKAFTVRYYLERLEGYWPPMATAAVAGAEGVGVAGRLVWPDFRDRMAVVARRVDA